ncbi:MAG: HEPN domain-containing protein, partial [Planctomycetota bacterium]
MSRRIRPDSPQEWLNRAHSDLSLAHVKRKEVYLEDLCFHAQQASEKAVKALLIEYNVEFPYVHDIGSLLTLLENTGLVIPIRIKQVEKLTKYAVFTRYPGIAPQIQKNEYKKAVKLAERI